MPILGIDAAVLAQFFEQQKGTIVEMFNMFSGGALERICVGVRYYAFITVNYHAVDAHMHPTYMELKKEGEQGQKISQHTRYATLVLATFQSIGIATSLPNMMQGLVVNPGCILLHCCSEFGNRYNVPNVVGRTNYRARYRQRHFSSYICRYCC